MIPEGANEAWEQVLAQVAAEADHAERLLTEDEAPVVPSFVLPVPDLPDPAEMPPLPVALRPRVIELRDRIDDLHRVLTAALAEPRRLHVPATVPAGAAVPRYLDRKV